MSAACSTGTDIGCSETSSILANQVKFKGFAVDHVCASYSYDDQGFPACGEQRRASLEFGTVCFGKFSCQGKFAAVEYLHVLYWLLEILFSRNGVQSLTILQMLV